MKKISEYKNRIVGFLDILGFENIVKTISENFELHKRLNYALQHIRYIEQATNGTATSSNALQASVFSDSIVISTANEYVFSLVWSLGWLQANLLYVGILSRGGVASGLLYHKDGIMYGTGFLSAYNLERKSAFYPRIIISNELISKHKKILSERIALDNDGFYFIDPFKFSAVASGAENLAADGDDPRAVYFNEVREHLINAKEHSSEENHLAKTTWMIKNFNSAISVFNTTSHIQIESIS